MVDSKTVINLTIAALLLSSTRPSAANQQFSEGSTQTNTSCLVDTDCPIWAECNNTKCVCKINLQSLRTVLCGENLQLSVIRCHCLTYDNRTDELFEGKCIENCENGRKSEYLPLPKDVSQLNQFMCEKRWNRTGRLCGRCLPGHSPLAYSYDIRCVKCPEGNKNIWKYILVAFGPTTIFYFIILIGRIKANSLYLHGYIVFSQIITAPPFAHALSQFLQFHQNLRVPWKTIEILYTMWNLDFFRGLYPDICLDVSPLTVLALDYAVAIYPLLLTVISYILIELHARNFRLVVNLWRPFHYLFSRFRRSWESKTTVIDAFATFFQLSFFKLALVSINLLIPVKAHSLNNGNTTWVVYYDASIEYFGTEHCPYIILAVICFVIFVLSPILLCLIYQFFWFQKLLSCLHIRHPLLREVMESFQSCYTNGTQGTKDRRWFSAVPYISCYLLLLTYAFTLESTFLPLAISIIIFIMMATILVLPYKKQHATHTKMDIIFWGILAIFFCTDESTMFDSLKPPHLLLASQILRIVVLLTPMIYIICITVYLILSRISKVRMVVNRVRTWRRGYESIEEFDNIEPHRLINPELYNEESLYTEPLTCSNSRQDGAIRCL
ncbi:uncharacterized protein LOC135343083 [Halichondria panicea]|uniref:uncharacterized protein LOC135343083 n=1 Tax=Halichondria panicea TaxID=6063 RepID=UPI00312BC900